MDWPLSNLLEELVARVETCQPRRILFWGEEAERIASYVAGWMAGKGLYVIVLDGANRFDPYMVSSIGRKMLIPARTILKRILIARAFTCYQMATLAGERVISFVSEAGHLSSETEGSPFSSRPNLILIGPLNTFLDEDVREGEARVLFDRLLRRMEKMSTKGFRFFMFQSDYPKSGFLPLNRWRINNREVGLETRKFYLMRRLFLFSDLVWKISLEDEKLKIVLGKDFIKNSALNLKQTVLGSRRIEYSNF